MNQFSSADLEQLKAKGISEATVKQQLARFRTGFPYLRIESPSAPGAGMLAIDKELAEAGASRWEMFLQDGGDVLKFVPASGAASRMFKALFAFVNGDEAVPAPGTPVAQLVEKIRDFAFYNELSQTVARIYGAGTTVESLIEAGLNYGQLPKALLTFHKYEGGDVRTALEEQLAEGAQTAASNGGKVRLHFTVSSNHRKLFEAKLSEVIPALEQRFSVKYDVSLSEQKPSTDTIAVTPDNELFRDDEGKLVFRPGGHGALIENLNDIDASVVFIKNIDNIVTDANRASTIEYKKLLGGILLLVHDNVEHLLKELKKPTAEIVEEATAFVEGTLCYLSRDLDERLKNGPKPFVLFSTALYVSAAW